MNYSGHIISVDMSQYTITEPTRQCLVCGRKEDPYSDTVYTDKAWLCDECRGALVQVVDRIGEIEFKEKTK